MEVTRIFDIVSHYAEQYPQQDTVLACKQNGQWRKIGVQEYVETINNISYGLLELGINQGDRHFHPHLPDDQPKRLPSHTEPCRDESHFRGRQGATNKVRAHIP